MKLQLKSRKAGDITFIETEILGAKVTLSKALTDKLKSEKKLKKELETDDSMRLIATTRATAGGKLWTNLFLTVKKDEKEAPAATEDDLPF